MEFSAVRREFETAISEAVSNPIFEEGEVIYNDRDESAPRGNFYSVYDTAFILQETIESNFYKTVNFNSDVKDKIFGLTPPSADAEIIFHIRSAEELKKNIGDKFAIRNNKGSALGGPDVPNYLNIYGLGSPREFPQKTGDNYLVRFENKSSLLFRSTINYDRLFINDEEIALFTIKEISPLDGSEFAGEIVFEIDNFETRDKTILNNPPIPLEFENVDADNDSEQSTRRHKNKTWARASIRLNTSSAINIGRSQIQRYAGLVMIQIFEPIGRGTDHALRVADAFVQALKNRKYKDGRIHTRGTDIDVVGMIEKQWFQINVNVEFDFDKDFNLYSQN